MGSIFTLIERTDECLPTEKTRNTKEYSIEDITQQIARLEDRRRRLEEHIKTREPTSNTHGSEEEYEDEDENGVGSTTEKKQKVLSDVYNDAVSKLREIKEEVSELKNAQFGLTTQEIANGSYDARPQASKKRSK